MNRAAFGLSQVFAAGFKLGFRDKEQEGTQENQDLFYNSLELLMPWGSESFFKLINHQQQNDKIGIYSLKDVIFYIFLMANKIP